MKVYIQRTSFRYDIIRKVNEFAQITRIPRGLMKADKLEIYADGAGLMVGPYKVVAFEKEEARHNKLQKLVQLVTKIRNYLSLPDDWDGYEGIAPESKTIEETISLVKRLNDYNISLPKPMVSGTGIVGLFWEKDSIYIEICFEGDGTFWYYGKDSNLEIGEESVSLNKETEFPKNLINLIAKI